MSVAPDRSPSSHLRTQWEQVLDEMERCALDGRPHEPPEGLGPLPAHLEHRALEVMAALRCRHRELLVELDAVGEELDALHRSGRAGARRRPTAAGAGGARGTLL